MIIVEGRSSVREPQQDRSRATLNAIVSATKELLRTRSFADIRIADIVASAGCTTGSFYARFASKDALLPYLYERYDEELTDRLEQLLNSNQWASLDLRSAIRRLVAESIRTYSEQPHLMREVTLFARRSGEQIGEKVRERRTRLQEQIAQSLSSRAHPGIGQPRPAAIGFAMFAAAAVVRERMLFADSPIGEISRSDEQQLEAEVVRLVMAYLETVS